MYRIGIDPGGTKLGVGVVNENGAIVSEFVTHDHTECDEVGIVNCMVRNVDEALGGIGAKRADASGLGVLFPGHLRKSRVPDGHGFGSRPA